MDAFLLTVYFLVVIYVLYQMALSLEDQLEDKVIIILDQSFLAEQTQTQLSLQQQASRLNLKAVAKERGVKKSKAKFPVLCLLIGDPPKLSNIDPGQLVGLRTLGLDDAAIIDALHPKIDIWVKPTGQQPVKPPIFYLSASVYNNTPDIQVYLNWDYSSLEMFGQGNRVVRSVSNMPRDLSQAQIHTVVNPGQTVTSNVAIERNYIYNSESSQMELRKPIVDLDAMLEMSKLTDPTTESKNIEPLYNLDLAVGLNRVTGSVTERINLLIPFSFELEIKPDQVALPPLRWLLRRTGQDRQRIRSWLWGKPKG